LICLPFAIGIRLASLSSDYCVQRIDVSHLTVSYVSQTAPGSAPVAGVAAAADAPAADSPLGFLGALIDQLLAAPAAAAKTSFGESATPDLPAPFGVDVAAAASPEITAPPATDLLARLSQQLDDLQSRLAAGETIPAADIDALDAAIAQSASAVPVASPPSSAGTGTIPAAAPALPATRPSLSDAEIVDLLVSLGLVEAQATTPAAATTASVEPQAPASAGPVADLRERLIALSRAVTATAPQLALKLESLAAQLPTAEIVADVEPGAPLPDPDALTIAHIIRTLLGKAEAASGDAPPDPTVATAAPVAQPQDELLRVLATLGLNATPVPASTAPAASLNSTADMSAIASVPVPLVRLGNQLTQLSTALADTNPALAQKLDAVAASIVSAGADANILGQLNAAANAPRDAAALDRLVQSLIDGKPAAASPPAASPQIVAAAALDIPAPIALKPTQSAVIEVKAAPPEPTSVAADSAPNSPSRPAAEVSPREPAIRLDRDPGPDARSPSLVAEAVKADPATAPSNPAAPQAAAPIGPAAQARALPAAYQAAANPINMGQIAFEMARQVNQGTSRFTIRLDPPEMGRVDVKLHVDAAGAVNARLTVERPETLDMFQRDQRSLERALAQAGLDAGKTSLEFSLRQNHQNPFAGMMGGDQRQQPQSGSSPRFTGSEADELAPMPAITLYRGLASAGGVNILA
jgi:flagellar hook-length control protein FliK